MKKFLTYDPRLLLYGFFILFFASYGQTFFIALFNNEIRIFYGLSDGEFGLVYAIATLSSSFILISFAKLIDHLDLRVYSFIITLGSLFACLGMVFLVNNILYLFLIILKKQKAVSAPKRGVSNKSAGQRLDFEFEPCAMRLKKTKPEDQ